MSRKNDRQPILIRLDPENFILMKTQLTPPGQETPPYGAMSAFINQLLSNHFNQKAQNESGKDVSAGS